MKTWLYTLLSTTLISGQAFADPSPAPSTTPPASTVSTPSQNASEPTAQKFFVGGQNTEIVQHVSPFHSPYSGTNSFLSKSETEATSTITFFTGYRVNNHFEAYLDPEESRGHGLSQGLGLGSFTNGEVVRTPTLNQNFYIARLFGRYVVPLSKQTEAVDQGELQLAGVEPCRRIVITGGILAVTDIFDVNRYANSPRTQFMSWGLINDAAYDYAADTRGYTQGIATEWIDPSFAVRFGAFQMPTIANGIDLSSDYKKNGGYNFEVELHPKFMALNAGQGIIRAMYMRNLAHMGNYREAIDLARQTDTLPSITATESTGSHKYGYYLNFEQPLADSGNTGIFGRAGYNDGQTEDFAYTEADRHLSLGTQISGVHWRRPDDIFAIALMQNDLSDAHKYYLAAGGLGFLLGDGKLNYKPERTVETYYNLPLLSKKSKATAFVGPDVQFVENPGYNADRGPVTVVSLRCHTEF